MVDSLVNIHRQNPPDWFKAADFGIFIHWGTYSVPAFAPTDREDFGAMRNKSQRYLFTYSPYAEWYANGMRIPDSPTAAYHRKHYGKRPYSNFAADFKKSAKSVDPEEWAHRFAAAGAKYVVVVTKHHEGFVMYDTHVTNPVAPDYHLDWDFVGDLAKAVRKNGMRFGVYYSSLLDWTFRHEPITSLSDMILKNDHSQRYLNYIWDQWHELIDRYHPDLLWNDIGYPVDPRLPQLFKDYYAAVPDGVVNDRWGSYPNWLDNPVGTRLFDLGAAIYRKRDAQGKSNGTPKYYDYRTLEYTTERSGSTDYFEVTRGMDKSFGYNQFSQPKDYLSATEIQRLIADLRPQKGRLLLNVGPKADGSLPQYQADVLNKLATSNGDSSRSEN